jgi:hypothetical protein
MPRPQDPHEQWRKIVSENDATFSSRWRALRRRLRRMSRRKRIASIALLLGFALVALYLSFS